MAEERLLTVREVALLVGRSEETIRRWIWSGRLRARKLGNQHFMSAGDISSATETRLAETITTYDSGVGRNRKQAHESAGDSKPGDLPFEPIEYDLAKALHDLERQVAFGKMLGEKYGNYDLTEARRRMHEDYDD